MAVVRTMLTAVQEGQEDAFLVVDLDDVREKIQSWRELMPRVEPFYAVKCNEDLEILKLMASEDLSFDCASRSEIQKILQLNVKPEKIVYANPCKQSSHIKYAKQEGVKMMTFDNSDELYKIKQNYPNAELLLRLLPDDSRSVCRLGQKFGADFSAIPSLLRIARSLNLKVVGVSYHVGSGCYSTQAFLDALHLARKAFDVGLGMGYDWKLLDVGGGFPGESKKYWNDCTGQPGTLLFPEICSKFNETLEQLFPAIEGVRVIAEPGRFFVHSCATLCVNVIARRDTTDDYSTDASDYNASQLNSSSDSLEYNTSSDCIDDCAIEENKNTTTDESVLMYYVNEGVYGTFNNLIYDHAHVVPKVLPVENINVARYEKLYECSIWGHSCDGLDCIVQNAKLPKLDVDDWLYFPDMGAYTICAASNFNGFQKATIKYLNN